ncbi:hypothetical protein SLITO_v1c06790 [Spiroplasma litorale]|uniref:Uncharacterized protein n=1 Tax=Spiroplasma litorale TaxID=216942 RepID=A0A0K1W2B1_9MOLU|nr:hypothetical protein [Spiroplasma litorale]AKX34306.1 hypothetical protein SLITO_v1c06790 [Spiroplasma litorale]
MKLKEINEILDLFKNNNDYQFWKMGTNIPAIIETFFEKISVIKSSDRVSYINLISLNNRYKILCNNFDVTPSLTFFENGVSWSTMRQFLDVLEAFFIIKKNSNYSIIYDINICQLLNKNFDIDMYLKNLFKTLVDNFTKLTKHGKKLYYSIIVAYLVQFIENKDNEYIDINQGKYSNKKIKISEIKKHIKQCGYNFFINQTLLLGTSADIIKNNIQKLLIS